MWTHQSETPEDVMAVTGSTNDPTPMRSAGIATRVLCMTCNMLAGNWQNSVIAYMLRHRYHCCVVHVGVITPHNTATLTFAPLCRQDARVSLILAMMKLASPGQNVQPRKA